jgi:glycosyltransferase involved in cell wall biosynthesis
MKISVVIPTFRRHRQLKKCLQCLADQDLTPSDYEIIVADDENNPLTALIVCIMQKNNPRHHFVYTAAGFRRGPAAARNCGWRLASAPIVAFTDDDCLPKETWLRTGLDAFAYGVDAIWGKVIVPLPKDPTDYQVNITGLAKGGFVTANCFCKKMILARVGGFDERFFLPWREDTDLYFTLLENGSLMRYVDDAAIVHPANTARFGASIFMQKNNQFEPLLFKKHADLYSSVQSPIINTFYLIGFSIVVELFAVWRGKGPLAVFALLVWGAATLSFILARLKKSSHHLKHIAEMVITSILIPPLALFWRLVGAWRYRILFI